MNVALIQQLVDTDNDVNIARALENIAKAAQQGAQLVMLGEMFCCPYETKNFPIYAQKEDGANVMALSQCAKEHQIYLVAGSMPEEDQGKIYNTCYVFDPTGKRVAKHRKMHLFDIDVVGGQRFMESETLTAGQDITTFETPFGLMGVAICFDIRFPELSRAMALRGAKALLIPAAFNMTTGPAHWELLFRSRALDNQLYALGAAPARDPESSYQSYGNTIVASPWGDVIGRLDHQEGILFVELDAQRVSDVRAQLPMLSARREDVYQLTECQ